MATNPPDDRLYFRQLLSGRDFAVNDPIAQQMVNFVYAIGDRITGECLLVDPAYCGRRSARHRRGRRHAGDRGAGDALPRRPCRRFDDGTTRSRASPRCSNRSIARSTCSATRCRGCSERQVSATIISSPTTPATSSRSGPFESRLVHTPGHTPGSQCFHVDGRLVSGDTLFLDGCGRTDLPGQQPGGDVPQPAEAGGDADGHDRLPGPPLLAAIAASMESIRENNYVFRPKSAEQWLQMFGG